MSGWYFEGDSKADLVNLSCFSISSSPTRFYDEFGDGILVAALSIETSLVLSGYSNCRV